MKQLVVEIIIALLLAWGICACLPSVTIEQSVAHAAIVGR